MIRQFSRSISTNLRQSHQKQLLTNLSKKRYITIDAFTKSLSTMDDKTRELHLKNLYDKHLTCHSMKKLTYFSQRYVDKCDFSNTLDPIQRATGDSNTLFRMYTSAIESAYSPGDFRTEEDKMILKCIAIEKSPAGTSMRRELGKLPLRDDTEIYGWGIKD